MRSKDPSLLPPPGIKPTPRDILDGASLTPGVVSESERLLNAYISGDDPARALDEIRNFNRENGDPERLRTLGRGEVPVAEKGGDAHEPSNNSNNVVQVNFKKGRAA